jgi:peptidoglycan-N-acetylglucosamine deacetylase
MPRLRAVARHVRKRAWLTGWTIKDGLARVSRRVAAGEVALTFDDGPHPTSTGPILDILSELQVRATFFCVGRNAQAHPDLVRRILAEGHAVGSHSLSHPHPRNIALSDLVVEYDAGRRAVAQAADADIRLFRPPHGHISFRSAVMLRRERLFPWLWTVDPQDWRPGVSSGEVASVAGAARSGDVVLLHDWVEQPLAPEAQDRSATVAALPRVIQSARDRGLRLTTLASQPPEPVAIS